MRAIFNAFTRIRFVKEDGTLDFDTREGLASLPRGSRRGSCGRTAGFSIS